jgi:hypothetical protein
MLITSMDHQDRLFASIAAAGKPNTKKRKNGRGNDGPLRQGKWTSEEEVRNVMYCRLCLVLSNNGSLSLLSLHLFVCFLFVCLFVCLFVQEYVHCLIDEFKTGMMPLAEGTSMRVFLSKMLNCHPMRISKKFVGSNYAGKSTYSRLPEGNRLSNEEVQARRAKLCDLERKFLAKIQGKKGAAATPLASSMEAVASSIGSNTALSFPTLAGGGAGGITSSSRVNASDLELRNLMHQQANTPQHGHAGVAGNGEVPLNISLLGTNDSSGGLGSTQSLQDLFADLVNNNGNGGNSMRGLNQSGSLEAFQSLWQQQPNSLLSGTTQHSQQQQQQQHHHHQHHQKANARAAAAGRALLESGGGLDLGGVLGGSDHAKASMMKPPPSSINGTANKPLAEFTSAELAAELQNRSSLTDLMASLGGGTGATGAHHNISQASLASLQDSLHQSQSANAFSTLMRNSSLASSIDMSNLMERQGSIDSLSNLAIRSHLHSIHSMGSLLDPILEGGGNSHNNSTWTPSASASLGPASAALGLSSAATLNMNSFLAANAGNMFGSNNNHNTGNNMMQSLGPSEQLRNAISNSGLDLASLLNNEDALRRLEAIPSSLNHSFSFQGQNNNSFQNGSQRRGPGNDSHSYSTATASADQNTAIAQFLLQKKLMEQQQSGGGNIGNRLGSNGNVFGGMSGNNDEQEIMRNMASVPGVSGMSSAGGSASMNPIMSSLLSTVQSRGGNSDSAERRASQQGSESHGLANGGANDPATMEALKRKFLSGRASQEELMTAMEEHRRNKPFR